MTRRAWFAPDVRADVAALANRQLPLDEFRAWADGPIGDEERAEMIELIDWFIRRYPTPAARLQSARRRQRQLARTVARLHASGEND
jgi:hypothetical protein